MLCRTGYGNNYRTATTQQYAFGTDIWGRTTEISVGSGTATRSLAKYNYSGLNLRTAQLGYNSYDDYFAVIYYTRDDLGRMTEIGYLDADGAVYDDYFFYTAEGALSEMYRKVGTTITERYAFEYDALGRLVRTKKLVGDTTVLQTEHTYDVEDRIAGQIYRIGTTNFSQSYTYSASNGLLTRHTPVFGLARTYGYDGIRRLSSVSNGLYTKTYGYKTVSGSRSSSLVSSLAYSGLGLNYTYGYDTLGNITSVVKNGSTEATYAYDLQNQLVSEIVGGNIYSYNYDTVGNLMSVQKNGTTIKSYTYGDSAWADLLTAFTVNGVTGSITYDNVGNPLTYYNGTSYAMTWTPERRLATLTGGGKTVSYAYDMDGIRTSKTVNGTTTSYTTVSGQVVREVTGSSVIDFAYEDNGAPYAMRYNGSIYYYLLNLQGDVVGLVDAYGNTVASYTYDAWGNVLSATGSLAAINPLRYRGYYYDSETGLYYVSSRYYDPMVGRFISPDTTDILTATPMGLTDKNLYAYCDNNPVVRVDHGGRFWETVFDVISLGASIVEVCVNPTDPRAWAGLAGDVIDLIPFVTGVGEVTRAVKTTVKVVDKATDVVDTAKTIYKTADAASDIRKATGSYEILYKSGKNYIGKGGFNRAITSATRNATKYGDEVTSIMWKSAPNSRSAFIDEYLMQKRFGGVLSSNRDLLTYNKIWSPGRRYFGD